MKIVVSLRTDFVNISPVETYALSMVRVLREKGHEVLAVPKDPVKSDNVFKDADFLLDIECGRDKEGRLRWQGERKKIPIPSAIYLIDSHGHPTPHKRISKYYDHVFFAVWDKRDLFAKHPSAHWCPNFTDTKWFDKGGVTYMDVGKSVEVLEPRHFGFFGSRGGLNRTVQLKEICERRGWTCIVKQIGDSGKQRWPQTTMYMDQCQNLFNHAQKHDGPNLRVMESMAVCRPLICDTDPRSGMDKLFKPWKHYIPFNYDYTGLEDAMFWVMNYPDQAKVIADQAYIEVVKNHLVGNRIDQILEVVNV
jgi:hypothetical protein